MTYKSKVQNAYQQNLNHVAPSEKDAITNNFSKEPKLANNLVKSSLKNTTHFYGEDMQKDFLDDLFADPAQLLLFQEVSNCMFCGYEMSIDHGIYIECPSCSGHGWISKGGLSD